MTERFNSEAYAQRNNNNQLQCVNCKHSGICGNTTRPVKGKKTHELTRKESLENSVCCADSDYCSICPEDCKEIWQSKIMIDTWFEIENNDTYFTISKKVLNSDNGVIQNAGMPMDVGVDRIVSFVEMLNQMLFEKYEM